MNPREQQIGATVVRTCKVRGDGYSVTVTTIGAPSRMAMFDTEADALAAHAREVQHARCAHHMLVGRTCPTCSD